MGDLLACKGIQVVVFHILEYYARSINVYCLCGPHFALIERRVMVLCSHLLLILSRRCPDKTMERTVRVHECSCNLTEIVDPTESGLAGSTVDQRYPATVANHAGEHNLDETPLRFQEAMDSAGSVRGDPRNLAGIVDRHDEGFDHEIIIRYPRSLINNC